MLTRETRGKLSTSPSTEVIFDLERPIVAPSSRRQTMCGCGWPLAAHVNDTFDPSRTVVSELDSLSMISGGTATQPTRQFAI